MTTAYNCLIMGAAGRDFHNFQTFFRERPEFRVRAFTAAQIPFIELRVFPRCLAGPLYDSDIPIYPESQLPDLIRRLEIDFVFLAYSDLSHEEVMHKASLVQACGASFSLLGPRHTQLATRQPVIAVTAVRTGAGKSPLSQFLAKEITSRGPRVGILRHPMPYGDLQRQAVERLTNFEDLQRFECTVEEREEYEPYLEAGLTVFAGVDYAQILARAEAEADILLWDGGNNDFSFLCPTVSICVVDALRPGHETTYYPGETNLRMADVIVINKVGQADARDLAAIRNRIATFRSEAIVIESDLEVAASDPALIGGKRVLVVEDGPTLTHGGMSYGAGTIAARRFGARELVDPRATAVGSIADAYQQYPHLHNVLPALGYSDQQRRELAETIEASGAEVVVDASPCRLDRLLNLSLPMVRVRYRFAQLSGPPLVENVLSLLDARCL
jgi:predicted GTPase